jgi:hypothetical protein
LLAFSATAFGAENKLEQSLLLQLLDIRRVYVDRMTGGDTAAQMREMIISSLQSTKLFLVTENQERADSVIKGGAEDLVFNDTFSSSDGVNARANAGRYSGSTYSSRQGSSSGIGIGDNESTHIVERKHEAVATVRLVNKDGDVIWSTTQESLGGKFRGASADVADKISKQLAEDFDRARKLKSAAEGPTIKLQIQ